MTRSDITSEIAEVVNAGAREASVPPNWQPFVNRTIERINEVVGRHLDRLTATLRERGAAEMDMEEHDFEVAFNGTILEPDMPEAVDEGPSAAQVDPVQFNALVRRVDALAQFARSNGYRGE